VELRKLIISQSQPRWSFIIKMVKYRIPQSEIDEANKNSILGIIRYYTFKEGGVDLDKISPETLIHKHGLNISLDEAKVLVQQLISEGKVVKVT